jgi:hypothetical protein
LQEEGVVVLMMIQFILEQLVVAVYLDSQMEELRQDLAHGMGVVAVH